MSQPTRTLSAALLLASLPLFASAAPKPVKDTELGLSKPSVFDVPSPPAFHAEEGAPGDKPLPKRIGAQIPPVIPHGVADFLPITVTANSCVDCHAIPGPKKKGEPTPVPASHYVDLRHAPDKKGDKVAGGRWICISCHVPRTDAPPAVGSTFRP
jgi:nitrate reductase cytochrome c-type subunit